MKLYPLALIVVILIGCTQNTKTQNSDTGVQIGNSDSIEIIKVLKDVYQWHNKNKVLLKDFDVIVKDSFQTALNYDSFNKTFNALRKTGFFSSTFLENYKKIAAYINVKLTNANPKYLNEINFASQEADPWTGFQDDTPNFWNDFEIVDYKLISDTVSLKWFIKSDSWSSAKYQVKLIMENGKWKVSYLEGFDMELYYK